MSSKSSSPTSLAVDIKVQVGEGEPIESALRRFKREVNKSGHLMDLRHKRYFENSQDRKKRKIVQARFRIRMERMNARRMKQQRT
jgi:small subunit ribosomal protein S21